MPTPEEIAASAQGTATATETKPEKMYDLEKGWIDKPADLKFENPDTAPKPPVGKEPEPKIDPPAGNQPPKEAPPKTDPPVTSTFNKEKFSKYGIEKEDDVYSTLDSIDTLIKENEELKKRPTDPQFKSEVHKKLFGYLEQYPESTWNEVLKTGGEIMGIDPDAADGKKVLQEAFVLQHPMLSREDALFEFEQEFAEKYNLKPKEEYEEPAKYDQDKRRTEIRRKIEEDKARQIVREAKSKLIIEKKPETTAATASEVPAEQVQAYSQEIEKVLDGTIKGSGLAYIDKDFIRVKADEKGAALINIQLPADKMKELRETAMVHIKNPGVYDKSGKIPNFDPAKGTLQLAFALWPEWISQQMAKQVDTLASIKTAEQIASTAPDKIETVQGKDVKTMGSDEQFRELARKEREARERAGQRR